MAETSQTELEQLNSEQTDIEQITSEQITAEQTISKKKRPIILDVLKDTIPVMAGYVMLGAGFGIIMSTSGYSIWLAILMSIFVYAGSMQYAAVGLFTGGVSYLTVALTTLAVNARHLFYGISMIDKYKGAGWKKPYMIHTLSDETYSLLCKTDKGQTYCFLVSLFDQCYWVIGTIIGAVIGGTVQFNSKGVDFVLTALFVTIFTDQWLNTKNHMPAITGVLCTVISLLIFGKSNFLIAAMVGITVLLLLPIGGKSHE